MGKRYSDGGIKERPDYDGINAVKDASLGVKHNIKIILLLLLIPIIGVGSYFGYKYYLNYQNNNKNNAVVPVVSENNQEDNEIQGEYIGGYKVIGSIQIEKIYLDAKILNPEIEEISYIDDALKYGVVKLYGDEINEIGNFCMIAHDTSEFVNLHQVVVGDAITVCDENGEKMNYTVTEIMHVSPEDLTVLLTNEYETEITLITCEEGATTRLVVKAVNN